jgi:ribosome-binding factor A
MSRSTHKRTARIASLVREVISSLIVSEVKDPRVQKITLTDVEVTGDLREARVFFAHHGTDQDEKEILVGLERATGFLRRELGKRIRLRVTPSLQFRVDRSLDYGARIEKVLHDIKASSIEPVGEDESQDD